MALPAPGFRMIHARSGDRRCHSSSGRPPVALRSHSSPRASRHQGGAGVLRNRHHGARARAPGHQRRADRGRGGADHRRHAEARDVNRCAPMVAGLAVAWGGPALLLTPAVRRLGGVTGLVAMWAFLATVAAIVIVWEKKPLASIGLRRLSWRSIAWGLLLAIVTRYVTIPILTALLRWMGVAAFEEGMAKILFEPFWIRALGALTAGIVEDALFIGYAFTRLELLTRSR